MQNNTVPLLLKKKSANNSVTNETLLQGNVFIQTRQEHYAKKQKKKINCVFSPQRVLQNNNY